MSTQTGDCFEEMDLIAKDDMVAPLTGAFDSYYLDQG